MADGVGVVRERPIKVLSWNIHGRGTAEVRRLLVPRVVRVIDPDIMLLQETKTNKLVNAMNSLNGITWRFTQVRARKQSESRILYKRTVFQSIPDRETFPGREGNENITLQEVLNLSINDFVETQNEEQRQRLQDLLRDRISIVGLKRRPYHHNITIFMSFHNVYNTRGVSRIAMRDGFIAMVDTIQELTQCTVVAGADLNQHIRNPGPTVLDYVPTERRRNNREDNPIDNTIDYFIQAQAPIQNGAEAPAPQIQNGAVTAWDFIGAAENNNNPLHRVIIHLLRDHENIGIDDYGEALDHDPLVYELTIPA